VRSPAFDVRRTRLASSPAVFGVVGSDGRHAVRTRIPPGRTPGRYRLTARCLGGGSPEWSVTCRSDVANPLAAVAQGFYRSQAIMPTI
jgi:hypothetical protein